MERTQAAQDGASHVTVVVADRHALVRRALSRLVSGEPGYEVVGEAPDAEETLRVTCALQPRLLLVEPAVLGPRRLAELPLLLARAPETRAVVLADDHSPALARQAELHGAAGTVVKHAPPAELFGALGRLAAPGAVIPFGRPARA